MTPRRLALAMTERELQDAVVDLAHRTGWLCLHVLDSRKSMGVGYPDLTMVHKQTGALMFVELKSSEGRVTEEQRQWLGALGRKHHAGVWRPEDWTSGHIAEVLQHPARFAAVAR
jgi:VRR-NUC domain